ncbi:hypothetical protein FQR65_LT14037 [Abscondita terminalis]|nr:hypothetical protein FQR65_LT14037 [Abscondita terminalis]
MDGFSFVRAKLVEWGFTDLVEVFEGNTSTLFQGDTSLFKFLELEERGKEILYSYKTLIKFSRSALATLIIERELKGQPDLRITSKRFKELAHEVSTFPGEFSESYYVPYCKTHDGKIITAKGILWDKYINKRRIYRQIGLLSRRDHFTASSPLASPGTFKLFGSNLY